MCRTSNFGLKYDDKRGPKSLIPYDIQRLLHVKLRAVCFPELQELLNARLCIAWKGLFPMCYNKTNLHSNTSAQNGCCHTMKKPVTCDILGSLTHEYPPPDGATAQCGPWPPLQYTSRPLDSLFCLSTHLNPSSSGPWTRHPATSFLVFPGCSIVWTFHVPNVKSVILVLCLNLVFITFRGLL